MSETALLERQRIWQELESSYQNGTARRLARRSLALNFEDLPSEVVHMAKRCLLDAIGCGIGGYAAPGRPICERVVTRLGGLPEAIIIGSGQRTNVLNAALVNAFMVRYLDYNDIGGGGHNSDAIPSLLAVAEAEKRSGQDLLTSIVISYELGARFMAAVHCDGDHYSGYADMARRGWCTDIRGSFNMPPAIGRLMGLDEEQVANAIGATCVRSLPMNHLDANNAEFVMSKNLRFGFVAYDAIMSCLLASEGFVGPQLAMEGEYGFNHTVMLDRLNLDMLCDFPGEWMILDTAFKNHCANFTTQSSIQCTIALCEEHDIQPEQIQKMTIVACKREAAHTTAPPKKYPRNGESADHSAFYSNALAVVERRFGPKSFESQKFTDPTVLGLIERIDVVVEESWPELCLSGGVKIELRDGRVVEKYQEFPHGWSTDPMTDKELDAKFEEMASEYIPSSQVKALQDAIWHIDETTEISKLSNLLAFPTKSERP